MTKRIWVAELGAPHGVRGEIRLRSFTGDPMRLAKLGPLESEDGKRVFKITALRAAKDMMIARLDGVASRDHAATLARTRLYIARDSLPPLQADEFYHSDLIGLSVVDGAGQALGSVCAVHNFGAGDILEYQPASGGQTQMAAFSQAFVPLVDLAAGKIVIDSPDAEEDEQDFWRRGRGEALTWRASVLTLFPEVFPGPLGVSLAGKAQAAGIWSLETANIRDYALDRHRSVDDTPAGGGPGMVLRADVLARAIDAVTKGDDRPRLLMSARGLPLTQDWVSRLAHGPGVLIVCGRFEGVDERVIAARGLQEVSVGDYVLSGGEIAAMALLDGCVRLLPGVMGKEASGQEESFADGLLEYPHYTRPQVFEGEGIPEVLLSGDHHKIAEFRRAKAEKLTQMRRPDLIARRLGKSGSADG